VGEGGKLAEAAEVGGGGVAGSQSATKGSVGTVAVDDT
jgi:hypothetical protein